MEEQTVSGSRSHSNRGRVFALAAASIAVVVVLLAWWNARRSEEPARGTETEANEAAEKKEAEGDVIKLDEEALERIGLKTVDAELRPLGSQLQMAGVVGPNETRVAHIRALSTGVITAVVVRRGDRVTTGQPLLTYDNVELGQTLANYRGAVAALESARSEAEVARLAVERADRLVEIGGIAEAEHQRRRAEYAAAQASVRSSEAQLANFRQAMSRFGVSDRSLKDDGGDAPTGARSTLRAPFAGVVLDVQAVSGETVSPDRELATLADLSTVWIQGDVYERDLSAITEGREARVVTDAYPDEPFQCRVTYVSQALDPQTRTAKLRCEAKNANGRLRLQMFARMEIPVGAARDVLAIPREAIQDVDGQASVFVRTGDETFERRTVTLGATTSEWAEVRAGVERGARVVTTGAVMLKSRLKASEFAEEEEEEKKGK